MKVYTYSEARQNLSKIINISLKEEVIMKKDGNVFSIIAKIKTKKSPFDIKGVKTKATTADILNAVRGSREM